MTTLLMATADLPAGVSLQGFTRSTAQARTGSYSYAGTSGTLRIYFVPQSTFYFRFAVYYTSGSTFYIYFIETASAKMTLRNNGTIFEFRLGGYNGTILGSVAGGAPAATWTVIEGYIICHATTGRLQIKLNGALALDLTNINTTSFSYGEMWGTTPGGTVYFDDIVVCTDKWPGMGGLHVFEPTGAGSVTDWTGALPTLNTPAATSGTQHRFAIADAPASAAIVHRLGVGCTGKVTGQGYGAIKPTLNNDVGDVNALSVTPQYLQQYWPGVSLNDFNNLEIGVESA